MYLNEIICEPHGCPLQGSTKEPFESFVNGTYGLVYKRNTNREQCRCNLGMFLPGFPSTCVRCFMCFGTMHADRVQNTTHETSHTSGWKPRYCSGAPVSLSHLRMVRAWVAVMLRLIMRKAATMAAERE